MSEKYPIKQLKKMKGLGATTTKGLKQFAKDLGLMNEAGVISEQGEAHLDYRDRKSDGEQYFVATEAFARMYREHELAELELEHPGSSDFFYKTLQNRN